MVSSTEDKAQNHSWAYWEGYNDGYHSMPDRCRQFKGQELSDYQDGLAAGGNKLIEESIAKGEWDNFLVS